MKWVHEFSSFFAKSPASFRANDVSGFATRGAVQPVEQLGRRPERTSLSRECDENALGNVVRQMRVDAWLSSGDRVNERRMSPHEFAKGLLRAIVGVSTQQRGVVHGHGYYAKLPRSRKPDRNQSPLPTSQPLVQEAAEETDERAAVPIFINPIYRLSSRPSQ
jgi:hypothetical protein